MKKTSIVLLLLLIPGCSVWYDFTAYFNLYYNASLAFEQAEQVIKEQKIDNLSLLEPPVPSGSNANFIKVIEKCSRILQFDANSAFVDDALLMIGKSFYYQKVYIKAMRKFEELIAMGEKSDLINEATLWLAKTQMQQKNYAQALQLLNELKLSAATDDDDEMIAAANFEELKYLISTEKYDDAFKAANELVKFSSDGALNAEVLYKMGELYFLRDDFENSAESYRRVLEHTPSYDYEINSRIRYATALRNLDRPTDALKVLLELRSEVKYSDKYDYVDLELGKTYAELGQKDRALTLFYEADTSYASSTYLGNIRYELGYLYENEYGNYDSAVFYYNKALSSTTTAEYLPLIRHKAEIFNKYIALRTAHRTNLKNYLYVTDTTAFLRDSVLFFGSIDSTVSTNEPDKNKTETPSRDRERTLELEAPEITSTPVTGTPKTGTPPVRPMLTADSIIVLSARSAFDIGNLFFTDFNIIDSAFFYYEEILSEFSKNPYTPQVLYALAGCHLIYGDTLVADSIYRYIYDNFRNDKIVNIIAPKISQPSINFDFDPAKDLYASAEQDFLAGKYASALPSLYSIYENYPVSPLASKSLYTYGFILEKEMGLQDSATIVYDTLLSKFPNSVYALKVSPALQFYKKEKERIRIQIEDSLNRLKLPLKTDSLKTDSVKIAHELIDSLEIKPDEEIKSEKEIEVEKEENEEQSFLELIKVYKRTFGSAKILHDRNYIKTTNREPYKGLTIYSQDQVHFNSFTLYSPLYKDVKWPVNKVEMRWLNFRAIKVNIFFAA